MMSWAGFHVLRDLRADVFAHVQRLSLGYFTRHEAGDVMSRFTNDADTLQQVIGFGLVSVVQGALLIVWIIYNMLARSWAFALISLVTLPLMFIATRWFSRQARIAFRRARQEIGTVNADLQESISAVREVQAFSREDENIEQFPGLSNAATPGCQHPGPGLYQRSGADAGGAELCQPGGGGGGRRLLHAQRSGHGRHDDFVGVDYHVHRLHAAVQPAGAANLRPLDKHPERGRRGRAHLQPARRESRRGRPARRRIAALHSGRGALRRCLGGVQSGRAGAERASTWRPKPGEMIAIVGPTGAGKTTIINLLPRFWDVNAGTVTIDGHDVRDVTRHSLRQQMGIVLQDTFLFSDTVMNNIRYGRPDATDEEVMAAAQLARARRLH